MSAAEQQAIQDTHDVDDVDAFDDEALDSAATDDMEEVETDDESGDEAESAPEAKRAKADEAEEGDEEDKAEKPDDDKALGKKDHLLPASRYLFQRDKRREAEEQVEKLEAMNAELVQRVEALQSKTEKEVAKEVDERTDKIEAIVDKISALDEEVEELRLDGKAKEAAARQKDIRKLEREMFRLEQTMPEMPDLDETRAIIMDQLRSETALDRVITMVEQEYSILREGSDDYDAEAVEETLSVYKGLMREGSRPDAAMERAVKYVMSSRNIDVPQQSPPVKRKQEAIKRNMKAAKNQPPDMADVGHNSDRGGAQKPMDIMRMSIEEFESLGVDENTFLR